MIMQSSEEEFLKKYDLTKYDRPSVTADTVVFSGDKVLMVKRKNFPDKGKWALPGGFMEKGESAEQTAARELKEETGLIATNLRQLCFVSTPLRDPRGWITTVVFTANAEGEPFGSDDAESACFLPCSLDGNVLSVGNVKSRIDMVMNGEDVDINNSTCDKELAFDHAKILTFALKRRSSK